MSKSTELTSLTATVLAVLLAAMSSFAKTTTFIGQPGVADGDKFSVAANWDNGLPVAGDTLIVSSKVVSVVNDLENLSVRNLYLYKNIEADSSPTLSGNAVAIEGGGSLRPYKGSVVYNDISCAGSLTLGGSGKGKLYGSVIVIGNLSVNVENDNHVYAYSPVKAGTLEGSWKNGFLHLCSTGNSFGTCKLWYAGLQIEVANAVAPEFVIDWGNSYHENTRGVYYFGAYDQTANRIVGPFRTTQGAEITSGRQINGTGTLTLNGTADAISPCLIENSLSIVWNPSGNFTQTFSNRVHTTTGSLIVSNGTMRLAAGGKFANVKKVVVADGATFDLATAASGTLAALTTLNVYGTFKFAEATANPFSASSLLVNIGANGKLYVPSGVTLSLPNVGVKGVYLAADTYESGCGWIEGGGSVVVANAATISSWKAATSGNWNTGANWVDGNVPSANPTYITAQGANYDVAFDAATFAPPKVVVGNDADHTARLLVSGDTSLASDGSTAFEVTDGGVVEFASGLSSFTNTNTSATIATVSGSGVWRVSGGTNTMYFYNKGLVLKNGGTLQVTAGCFQTQNTSATYNNPFGMENGNLEVSGTGSFRTVNSDGEFNPMGSGSITATDDARLYFGRAYAGPNVAGVPLCITLRNRASFSGNSSAFFGDTLTGGETYIKLYDNATWSFGWRGGVGINRSCLAQMDIYDSASVTCGGYGAYIGSVDHKGNNSAPCFPTGIVNVVGGTFNGRANYYGNGSMSSPEAFQGVLVGGIYQTNTNLKADYRLHGELNVFSGGTYSQNLGYLAIGMDKGDGYMRIAGGAATKSGGGEILVGACGGNGLLEVTDCGSVTISSPLYIGGVDPSGLEIPRTWTTIASSSTAATGIVRVTDGTLDVTKAITLGERGTGVLEVGSNGVVRATTMTLKNNVASKLSFKFGEDGIGSVTLTGALTVEPGAELELDFTDFKGSPRKFKLLQADSISGTFDKSKIRVVGATDMLCSVRGNAIYAIRDTGLLIIYL